MTVFFLMTIGGDGGSGGGNGYTEGMINPSLLGAATQNESDLLGGVIIPSNDPGNPAITLK